MASLLCNRFVQVKQHPRNHRPCRHLVQVHIRRAGSSDRARRLARRGRCWFSKKILRSRRSDEMRRGFARARLASGAELEGVIDAASRSSFPPSFQTRKAIACAASTKTGSFKVVNACNGVLERKRRGQGDSPVGASKTCNDGYGTERFLKGVHARGDNGPWAWSPKSSASRSPAPSRRREWADKRWDRRSFSSSNPPAHSAMSRMILGIDARPRPARQQLIILIALPHRGLK